MLSTFKKLFFTFTFHSSLFILLMIGIQNNSIKKKVNILIGETVTGQTSGAQAVIKEYKPNPIQNIQE